MESIISNPNSPPSKAKNDLVQINFLRHDQNQNNQ